MCGLDFGPSPAVDKAQSRNCASIRVCVAYMAAKRGVAKLSRYELLDDWANDILWDRFGYAVALLPKLHLRRHTRYQDALELVARDKTDRSAERTLIGGSILFS